MVRVCFIIGEGKTRCVCVCVCFIIGEGKTRYVCVCFMV